MFKAFRLDTRATVAIKLPHPRMGQQGARNLFDEIALCRLLCHANIASLLDWGERGAGQPFAVFEYLPGETLRERLLLRGRMETRGAVRLMAQVLAALVHAHGQGIIHCDIKPGNIMLVRAGRDTPTGPLQAKLIDFGSAVRLPANPTGPAASRDAPGGCSPAYSAPEQLRGAPPSQGFDIYAWGLVLLECLNGQSIVSGHSARQLIARQTNDEAIPIPAHLAGRPLGALLRQATDKDGKRRISDAGSLHRELLQLTLADLDQYGRQTTAAAGAPAHGPTRPFPTLPLSGVIG